MAKLSFSPYLQNLPLSPTFMGPLYCFVLCLGSDCGKIVIFALFAKFGALANFYGAPILLCALPRWQLWQNCHFRHICQIRRFRQLLCAPFIALCFASLAIVAKLSFSSYLPNSPTLSLFCNFCCCVHFWTYLTQLRIKTLRSAIIPVMKATVKLCHSVTLSARPINSLNSSQIQYF